MEVIDTLETFLLRIRTSNVAQFFNYSVNLITAAVGGCPGGLLEEELNPSR